MSDWLKDIDYWLWASYRRQALDKLQLGNIKQYRGVVLDIGGRDRGRFIKPRDQVKRWIFADSEPDYNPDMLLDVADMQSLSDGSIDVVNAIELFEHVAEIKAGLDECFRVLKQGGTMLLSVPFLAPIHGDPDDWQRWTEHRWRHELEARGFKIEELVIMGRFFTVGGERVRVLLKQLPWAVRVPLQLLLLPVVDQVVKFDSTAWVKNKPALAAWHAGYWLRLGK